MTFKKTQQQILINEMTKATNWDVFLTLTFPWRAHKKTHDEVASTINALFRNVENKCYVRQALNNPIQRFITLEYSVSEGIHLHLLLVKPEDKSHQEFRNILRDKWQRLDGTGKQNMSNNSSFYQPIIDTDENRKYVSDYASKAVSNSYETVLFQCMEMNKATTNI